MKGKALGVLLLLTATTLVSCGQKKSVSITDSQKGNESAQNEQIDAGQSIDLRGDWHFKVYRKWSNMYQYLPYDQCEVTWEDTATAAVPGQDTYTGWEEISAPVADYMTGGLLQLYRTAGGQDDRSTLSDSDLFPTWSEAWFCKTINVPKDFTKEDKVTLLLGVIDDMDVVYVNGTPVAQSGFVDKNGEKADPSKVPADGGFDMAGDWVFEKSYWEVSREYSFDSSLLKDGKNDICVRLYNNNSFGGFYDRTMALASNKRKVNELKGLPIDKLKDNQAYAALIEKQTKAIESEDIKAYADTLDEAYNENELDKAEQIAAMQALFDKYDSIKVKDTDGGFYSFNDKDVYFTSRTITGVTEGEEAVILDNPEYIEYLSGKDTALVYGNHSHCYKVSYQSTLPAMDGKVLSYNIYLPPSYYESDKSYPVVYLLHGINSTGDSFVNVDKIEERMNEWISKKDLQEMIVVMPNAGKMSWYKDTDAPDGVNDNNGPWESFITKDIVGQIDSNYRTIAKKESRGITGISMGGYGSFAIGLGHLDEFTSIASHMGAVGDISLDKVSADDLKSISFYLDCGNQDQTVGKEATEKLAKALESKKADVTWELRDGGHNSAFYMGGMLKSMQMHDKHFNR